MYRNMKLPFLFLGLLFISFIQCEFLEKLDDQEENDKSEGDVSNEEKPALKINSDDIDISKEKDSSEDNLLKPEQAIKNGKSEGTKDDKILPIFKECKDFCLFEAAKKTIIDKTSVGEACLQGCQEQHKSLLHLQKIFKNTSPDLLLGSAIDNCWDGCSVLTEGQAFCISGCDKMRKIQKKMIKTSQPAVKDKVEKEEKPDASFENIKEDKMENLNGAADNGNTWTYYLLSPENDGLGAIQTYMSIMKIMDTMFREMDTLDMDTSANSQSKGWKGDRRQLNLPQYPARTAALTADNDYYSQLYDEVSASLGHIKKKVQDTVSTPGFKEYVFYIMLCISGIMLLQSVFNILLSNKEPRQPVDHFYLPPAGSLPPKLPTYDECMKDSQKLCVGLTQQEDICKVNLSLPVVALPLGNGNVKENVMEDADLKQDDNVERT